MGTFCIKIATGLPLREVKYYNELVEEPYRKFKDIHELYMQPGMILNSYD